MNYFTLLGKLLELKKNEKKSRKQMQEYQKKQLNSILKYAFYNSKYYHEAFINAGINENNISDISITDVPIIDKNKLIENFDKLITVDDIKQSELRRFDENEVEKSKLFRDKYHLVHSSGSTGLPAYFVYDEQAWNTMLVGIIRAALWNMSLPQMAKLLMEKPRVMYIAATDGRYGGVMAVGDGIEGLHMKQIHLNVQSPINEWIEQVNEFKPNIIIGYPSAIKILGELIQDKKLTIKLSRVITCGEPLHQNLEQMFQKVFEAPVVNVYAASESLALGVGISGTEGICLFDDLNFIEIVGDKMYLTCLYNYAQPLIRYRLSDELHLLEEPRNNSSPFTWVKTILGRCEDLMWFTDKDGKKEFLHPLSVEGICVEGLHDYQFIKTSESSFRVDIEMEHLNDEIRIIGEVQKIVSQILIEKKLNWIDYSVEIVDCIFPDEKTGKKKLVII